MTARKTAAKNMNTVNELALQFDGLTASLQEAFEKHKAAITTQQAIIERAKAVIELNSIEMLKAKMLAKTADIILK